MALLVEIGFRSGFGWLPSPYTAQPIFSSFSLSLNLPRTPLQSCLFSSFKGIFGLLAFIWLPSVWFWASHFISLNHLTSLSLRLPDCQTGITTESGWDWVKWWINYYTKVACYNDSFFCSSSFICVSHLPLFHLLPQRRQSLSSSLLLPSIPLSTKRLKLPSINKAPLPPAISAWRQSQLLPAHLQVTAPPVARFPPWERPAAEVLANCSMRWRRRQLLAYYPQAVET